MIGRPRYTVYVLYKVLFTRFVFRVCEHRLLLYKGILTLISFNKFKRPYFIFWLYDLWLKRNRHNE